MEEAAIIERPIQELDLKGAQSLTGRLREFTSQHFEDGTHIGKAWPGSDKPTLLKPGAELLARLFNLDVELSVADKTVTHDPPYVDYEYNCNIRRAGTQESIVHIESAGSCNSKERKYRRADPFDIKNTIQKMAQKRAYVGGILIATGASSMYSQDHPDDTGLTVGDDPTSRFKQAIGQVRKAETQERLDEIYNHSVNVFGKEHKYHKELSGRIASRADELSQKAPQQNKEGEKSGRSNARQKQKKLL
jgi:hypothetical protein